MTKSKAEKDTGSERDPSAVEGFALGEVAHHIPGLSLPSLYRCDTPPGQRRAHKPVSHANLPFVNLLNFIPKAHISFQSQKKKITLRGRGRSVTRRSEDETARPLRRGGMQGGGGAASA